MATRFYFSANAYTFNTPSYDGGWNYTTEASRFKLSTSQGTGSPTAGTQIGAWSGTAGQKALDRQYISDPLQAQSISGTFSCMLMTREYAGTDNVDRAWMAVKVIDSSGTVVATLFAHGNATGASTTELVNNATHRTNTYANGANLSSYSCADGDRILVEIGYGNNTAGTSPEASGKWGGTGTDATVGDNATTADRIGWFEVSGNLSFLPGPIVSAIAPDTGPEAGGTSVTITGTGFASGCTAAIASAALTGVSFGSTSSITGVTPAGSFAGNGNVTVTNPNGLSGTLAGGFAYDAPFEYQIWPTAIKAMFLGGFTGAFGYSGGTWPDLIGHASTVDFTQATSGLRPSVATTPAGNFMLNADGSDDYMMGGGVGGIASGVATGFYRWATFIMKPATVSPDAGQALQVWRGDDDDFVQIVAGTGKLSVTAGDTTVAALSNATLLTSDYTRVLVLTNTVNNTKIYLGAGQSSGMSLQATEGNGTWASRWAPGGFFNSFELFNHNNASRYSGQFGRLTFYQSTLAPTLPDIALLDAGLIEYIYGATGGANEYTMVAAPASMVASGINAGLIAQRKIVAEQSSFIASGIDVGLSRGNMMLASSASLTSSGIDAGLTKQSKLTAAVANLVASGIDASLRKQSKITAEVTSYTAVGIDASLTKQSKLTAAPAAIVASGIDVSLAAQRKILASIASLVCSGLPAALARGSGIVAAHATFLASGIDASLRKQSKITAEVAPFVVSGINASIAKSVYMVAAPASYVASGINASLTKQSKLSAEVADVSLTFPPVSLDVAMLAGAGAIVITPNAAGLTKQSKLSAEATALAISGSNTGLLASRKLVAEATSYALSYSTTGLIKASKLTANTASYVLSGIDAGLVKATGAFLTATSASLAITVNDANLLRTLRFAADAGAINITGNAAGLLAGRKIAATVGALSIVGNAAGLYANRKLTAEVGALSIVGNATGLRAQRYLSALTQALTLTGSDTGLYAGRKLAAAATSLAIVGQAASFYRGLALAADAGSLALTVNAANLLRSRIMAAELAAFSIVGNDVVLTTIQLSLSAQSASFVTVFPDVGLVWGQYVPPRQMVISLERTVPLVQIDLQPTVPLVAIDIEKAIPLVQIDLQPTEPLVAIDLERTVPLVSIELGEQPMSLRVGAVAVLGIKTRILGVLDNPDTLSIVVTSPSGVESTYVFGTHALIEYIPDENNPEKDSGRFRARIPCTEASTPGTPWRFTWYTGGETVGVESGQFTVDPV